MAGGGGALAGSGGFVTGSAVGAEPVADFARAAGVSTPVLVEAIAAEGAETVFEALGAGAPPSAFFGGAGLNESRIFCAAAASCERMCGICS